MSSRSRGSSTSPALLLAVVALATAIDASVFLSGDPVLLDLRHFGTGTAMS
jgi:hypothetical protein